MDWLRRQWHSWRAKPPAPKITVTFRHTNRSRPAPRLSAARANGSNNSSGTSGSNAHVRKGWRVNKRTGRIAPREPTPNPSALLRTWTDREKRIKARIKHQNDTKARLLYLQHIAALREKEALLSGVFDEEAAEREAVALEEARGAFETAKEDCSVLRAEQVSEERQIQEAALHEAPLQPVNGRIPPYAKATKAMRDIAGVQRARRAEANIVKHKQRRLERLQDEAQAAYRRHRLDHFEHRIQSGRDDIRQAENRLRDLKDKEELSFRAFAAAAKAADVQEIPEPVEHHPPPMPEPITEEEQELYNGLWEHLYAERTYLSGKRASYDEDVEAYVRREQAKDPSKTEGELSLNYAKWYVARMGEAARDVDELEKLIVERQKELFPRGLDPDPHGPAGPATHNFMDPWFIGDDLMPEGPLSHARDGDSGSMPELRAALQSQRTVLRAWILHWMNAVSVMPPPEIPIHNLWAKEHDDDSILPWESYSAAERAPRRKARIRAFQSEPK